MHEPQRNDLDGVDSTTVERAEQLLCELAGVVSSRIVADDGGKITEIHVLTDHRVEPKQTVRNVESALAAQLGWKIDHRKVSVAQARDPEEGEPTKVIGMPRVQPKRYLFDGYEFERKLAHRVACRVRLRLGEDEYMGSAEGADIESARLTVAAQAALDALEKAEGDITFGLDGVKILDVFEHPIVLVGMYGLSGRRSKTFLAGAAAVTESPEQAAILAALQATNRWITTP